MRVDLFFPEHAVGDIRIGSRDTVKDSFLDLRAGIVELELRKFLVFFLQFVSPDFCKTPANRERVVDDRAAMTK
ncbi:MAG: hypothetical protein ABSB80_02785 [Methanoregula sp.]|jgi:hypothetical protein|uniref:hypothetical protein n=1 Tax=Methanoregula sp. TaxID=2052170 RepID=UPI003D0B3C7E